MLDLVPLAGPRGEVAHADAQSGVVRESLQLQLPGARTVPVASPRVCRDEQLVGIRVRTLAHHLPPLPDRGDGELRGVMVAADADPRLVACHVVDPIRDGLAGRVVGEVVHQRLLGRGPRLPLPAAILEFADEFLLLGVDRNYRLLPAQERGRGRVDVLELLVAVGLRRPLAALAYRLQAVAQLVEHAAPPRAAHLPPVARQRRRALPPPLARPSQRRHRIAAGERIGQLLQGILHARLRLLDAGTSASGATHPSRRLDPAFDLPPAAANGLARQARCRADESVPAIADGPRLSRRPQTTRSLVEHRRDNRILRYDGGFQPLVSSHSTSKPQSLLAGEIVYARRLTSLVNVHGVDFRLTVAAQAHRNESSQRHKNPHRPPIPHR